MIDTFCKRKEPWLVNPIRLLQINAIRLLCNESFGDSMRLEYGIFFFSYFCSSITTIIYLYASQAYLRLGLIAKIIIF